MDCSLPGSSVCGILQARIVEWVAIPFSGGSSQPRDQTWVSCIAGGFFTVWTIREISHKQKRNLKHFSLRASLAVQWLRLWASITGDSGLIPGWGTKISHDICVCVLMCLVSQLCLTLFDPMDCVAHQALSPWFSAKKTQANKNFSLTYEFPMFKVSGTTAQNTA